MTNGPLNNNIIFTENFLNIKSGSLANEEDNNIANFTLNFSISQSKLLNYELLLNQEVRKDSNTVPKPQKLTATTLSDGGLYYLPMIFATILAALLVLITIFIISYVIYKMQQASRTNKYLVN